jgi:hypothetical protein
MDKGRGDGMKWKEKCFRVVDSEEVNAVIGEHFGIDYECVAEEQWGNDETHEVEVGPQEMQEYYRNKLKERKYEFMLHKLMDQMCFEGKLEAGAYLIEVYW